MTSPTEPTEPVTDPPASKPETDWKAEARKHETRAKENAAKAKQFDELLESQKTESQKLTDRAAAAEKERDEARVDALRARVGASKGLPADIVDLLKGSTEDELMAHADRLAAHFKATLRPSGQADQGTRGTPTGTAPRDQFADFINKQMGRLA